MKSRASVMLFETGAMGQPQLELGLGLGTGIQGGGRWGKTIAFLRRNPHICAWGFGDVNGVNANQNECSHLLWRS